MKTVADRLWGAVAAVAVLRLPSVGGLLRRDGARCRADGRERAVGPDGGLIGTLPGKEQQGSPEPCFHLSMRLPSVHHGVITLHCRTCRRILHRSAKSYSKSYPVPCTLWRAKSGSKACAQSGHPQCRDHSARRV